MWRVNDTKDMADLAALLESGAITPHIDRTPRGVNPAELAVLGPDYADELRKRGFSLTVS